MQSEVNFLRYSLAVFGQIENFLNRPFSRYWHSYLAPRLGRMKQKKCIISCWASRWLLLFYSPKPGSHVWILIYRKSYIDKTTLKIYTKFKKLSRQKFHDYLACEVDAHYVWRNAEMNLKCTTTNAGIIWFNFRIINLLIKSWGKGGVRLTWLDCNNGSK